MSPRKKYNPYYELILAVENDDNIKKYITMKYDRTTFEENYDEFRDLLKCLYICHYCPNLTGDAYKEVHQYCYFSENETSLFNNIWQHENAASLKRFVKIELIFYNNHNIEHDALKHFDEDENNDITSGMKKHYQSSKIKRLEYFSDIDSGVIVSAYYELIKKNENNGKDCIVHNDDCRILVDRETNYKSTVIRNDDGTKFIINFPNKN